MPRKYWMSVITIFAFISTAQKPSVCLRVLNKLCFDPNFWKKEKISHGTRVNNDKVIMFIQLKLFFTGN